MNKMKRLFGRMNASINTKMFARFVLVLILSLSLVGFTYYSNTKIKEMYGNMLDISMVYSDLYLTFEQTGSVLDTCAETGDPQDCKQYDDMYPKLL